MYEHEHNKKMSTSAIAAMLSTILYYKRFFPYYVYNIIGGIDDEGMFSTFAASLYLQFWQGLHLQFSRSMLLWLIDFMTVLCFQAWADPVVGVII